MAPWPCSAGGFTQNFRLRLASYTADQWEVGRGRADQSELTCLQVVEPVPDALLQPEVDAAGAGDAEADGEVAALVQQRHALDGGQPQLQQVTGSRGSDPGLATHLEQEFSHLGEL